MGLLVLFAFGARSKQFSVDMTFFKSFFKIFAVLSLISASLHCLTTSAFSQDKSPCKVKIGMLLPLTGPASLIGERSEQAARLALEQLPKDLSERLSIIFEDTEMKPASGFRAVQKLLTVSSIVGLAGFGSETVGASADFIERKKIPGIFVTPDRKPIVEKKYLFRHWVDGDDMRGVITPELKRLGLSRISLIFSEIPAMAEFADNFTTHSSESGLKIVYSTNVLPSDLDFRTAVATMLKSKPDAIFFFLLPPQISVFMKQLRSIDSKIPVFTYINTENSKEILAANGSLEGVTYAGPKFEDKFVKLFSERFSEYPEFASGNIFDIINIYAQALDQGACTAEEFRAKISTIENFTGALGTYGIVESNDFRFPVRLKQIKGGKFEFLHKERGRYLSFKEEQEQRGRYLSFGK